ncbi:hypothetical protein [Planktothrix mougeotii]|uniref:Uncharacterized protein n=1 Tax=Planktothrix mougeotii LEGE 06226 TaxID=1828728 RepID=A0ABR9UG53_9CYAN|nr:hypothetical protein [Planktothrix mougeotii]MBE9145433.1 hypothetical protein [Planktothrix mougeotii LEGE 06226]
MSQPVDLNLLRNQVLNDQQNNSSGNVYVDDNGNIIINPLNPKPNQSKIPGKVFAASLTCDRQTVSQKLPNNTRELYHNGVTGWLYEITSQLGDDFTFFAYNDGSQYQVLVVFPEVAGLYGVHDAHLFNDGSICLQDGGGMPTLESAYAKSVLWASGFSIFARTGQFPFSINNY